MNRLEMDLKRTLNEMAVDINKKLFATTAFWLFILVLTISYTHAHRAMVYVVVGLSLIWAVNVYIMKASTPYDYHKSFHSFVVYAVKLIARIAVVVLACIDLFK